jgi:hypothetical protein
MYFLWIKIEQAVSGCLPFGYSDRKQPQVRIYEPIVVHFPEQKEYYVDVNSDY